MGHGTRWDTVCRSCVPPAKPAFLLHFWGVLGQGHAKNQSKIFFYTNYVANRMVNDARCCKPFLMIFACVPTQKNSPNGLILVWAIAQTGGRSGLRPACLNTGITGYRHNIRKKYFFLTLCLRHFLTEPATGCGGKVPRNSKSKKTNKELLGIPLYSPCQNPSRTAKKIFFTTFLACKTLVLPRNLKSKLFACIIVKSISVLLGVSHTVEPSPSVIVPFIIILCQVSIL